MHVRLGCAFLHCVLLKASRGRNSKQAPHFFSLALLVLFSILTVFHLSSIAFWAQSEHFRLCLAFFHCLLLKASRGRNSKQALHAILVLFSIAYAGGDARFTVQLDRMATECKNANPGRCRKNASEVNVEKNGSEVDSDRMQTK